MAGNLGYEVTFVLDATRAYDMTDVNGKVISADEVMRMTGANLDVEFATVVDTKYVLERFSYDSTVNPRCRLLSQRHGDWICLGRALWLAQHRL